MAFLKFGVASSYQGGFCSSGGSGTSSAGGASGAGAVQPTDPPPPVTPHVDRAQATPNASSAPANVIAGSGVSGGGAAVASALQVEHPPQNLHPSLSLGVAAPVTPGESAKRKRGRPRKYAPDGTNLSTGLPRSSPTTVSSESKRTRGRPPGTGWKQQLAALGELMNNSAGLAWTPHSIVVAPTEDVTAKILALAQQRPRALCIKSATGSVSAVTLRQPIGIVTYEGRFELVSLSGSYLPDAVGGPLGRTGGISMSMSTKDGEVIGGAVGGRVIAASEVKVTAFSFIYSGKPINKIEASEKGEKSYAQPGEKSLTPETTAPDSATGDGPTE